MSEGKEMEGGAVKETATVTTPETVSDEGPTMTIVTTAKGTLSDLGIVPVGTEAEIHPRRFSHNWMRPKFKKDASTFAKWEKDQAEPEQS